MALSNEDLLKELSAKPIMEVVELVKMLEDEWGVSAAAPVAAAAAPGAGGDAAEVEEQTEFDVVMSSYGENKVSVIKAVRTLTERYEIAAVITEPVLQNIGIVMPQPGYLEGLRALADEHEFVLSIPGTGPALDERDLANNRRRVAERRAGIERRRLPHIASETGHTERRAEFGGTTSDDLRDGTRRVDLHAFCTLWY